METPHDQFWQHVLDEKTELPDSLQTEIARTGPENTFIHLFNHYNGASAMSRCFFLLFPFWKDFTFQEWQHIFQHVTDRNAGQYYLNYNFKSLLGIDPGFVRYDNKTSASIQLSDMKVVSGLAVFELNENMRKRYEDQLAGYGITLDALEQISDRLIREGAKSLRGMYSDK